MEDKVKGEVLGKLSELTESIKSVIEVMANGGTKIMSNGYNSLEKPSKKRKGAPKQNYTQEIDNITDFQWHIFQPISHGERICEHSMGCWNIFKGKSQSLWMSGMTSTFWGLGYFRELELIILDLRNLILIAVLRDDLLVVWKHG